MKTTILILIYVVFMPFSTALGSLVVGRVDNFEDGTIQGWSSNAGHENIPGGGPDGADDHYLQIQRPTNLAPYPFHLGTKNTTTWTGDYLSAGIKSIAMDVNTISITTGPANLSLRIVLFGPGGAFSSKEPVTVITGAGWQHVEFGLARSNLVRILGAGAEYLGPGPDVDDLTATLSNVSALLIRHDLAPIPTPIGQHPEHIMATLGIDNITAVLGPAPTYNVAWTFGNIGNESYVLDRFEPSDIEFGEIGTANPTLLLHIGKRYQVTVMDPIDHPFELIAKHIIPEQDDVLISAGPDQIGLFEDDPEVEWFDNESGTVAFTLTNRLYDALISRGRRAGYRCGQHISSIRGDIDICTDSITIDLCRDYNVPQKLTRTGWKAQLSTLDHGVSGEVEILNADTLLIENFNYDGGGSEVYFYLAPENNDTSFLTGIPVGPTLSGNIYVNDILTIDLPPDLTIDSYNAISVWSVDSAANFGSGTFGSEVQYEVTFDATWSAETHLHFPSNPHFSGLIGGTHNDDVAFWQLDDVASDGIEDMAETGSKSQLNSEVNKAIRNGSAYSIISGGGIGRSPGSVSTTFEINSSHPFATVVSMIAPSPDWFVGVSGLKLFQDGQWIGEAVIVLDPYDAGSDSGINFTSVNDNTNPRDHITLLTDFPFEDKVPLGTFTFRLRCQKPPSGDINGDCRVDFSDLVILLSNWMLDCNLNPSNPACQ